MADWRQGCAEEQSLVDAALANAKATADGTSTRIPKRRRPRASTADTRVHIILTAEDLFAEKGIEAVSLREIAARSRHGNSSAVQYHFASKEALLYEIFLYRLQHLDDRRLVLLNRARKSGTTHDAKVLLAALCLPYLDAKSVTGRYRYVSFLSQYLNRYIPEGSPHPLNNDRENYTGTPQLLEAIFERISYIPRELARYRVNLTVEMFLNAIMMYDNGRATVDFETLINDTLEGMAASLCAPIRASDASFEELLSP